jgi:hypothetical protein
MESDETHNDRDKPDEPFYFAPIEDIQSIETVISKLEITHKELQKVAEGMKPIEEL